MVCRKRIPRRILKSRDKGLFKFPTFSGDRAQADLQQRTEITELFSSKQSFSEDVGRLHFGIDIPCRNTRLINDFMDEVKVNPMCATDMLHLRMTLFDHEFENSIIVLA